MSAPTIVRDLVVAHTRVLKLPGVARTFEGLARQARDAHWPHEDYLHEVLSAEQASRHESVRYAGHSSLQSSVRRARTTRRWSTRGRGTCTSAQRTGPFLRADELAIVL